MSTIEGGRKIVAEGLVFYVDAANVKSYVSGSTTWNDLTRNEVNCICTGTSVYDSSNMGSVLFDGTEGKRFITPPTNTYNVNNGITMSCWVDVTTVSVRNVIFSHDSGNNGYRFQLVGGNLTFTLGGVSDYTTSYSMNNVGWKNIVASVSGNTANIYVNGDFITAIAIGNMNGSPNLFRIGQNPAQNDYHFIGKVSSAMLYNIPLNSNQIQQNYNAMKNRFGL